MNGSEPGVMYRLLPHCEPAPAARLWTGLLNIMKQRRSRDASDTLLARKQGDHHYLLQGLDQLVSAFMAMTDQQRRFYHISQYYESIGLLEINIW